MIKYETGNMKHDPESYAIKLSYNAINGILKARFENQSLIFLVYS